MRYFKSLRFIRNHTIGEDGEVQILEGSSLSLNREIDGTEHNYNLQIYPSKRGGYGLAIYLAMTAPNANSILVYRENYTSQKEAEKDACRVLNELERANLNEYINEWKSCNVKPVFDEKYNYIGDIYAPILFLKENAKSFDYFNTNPINKFYGTFYILDKVNNKNCYKEETVGLGVSVSKMENNPRVMTKLLSKLNKKKYSRFFE